MAKRTKPSPEQKAHETTGVPQLDMILGGGLPRGALVLLMGLPGSGKTTLASQIAFMAAHAGKRVLILTTFSESTGKLMEHLATFSFYDHALIGDSVQLFSLQATLTNGLKATSAVIVSEARRFKADIVLLDGFRGMRSVDDQPQAAREFLYDLGTSLALIGTTTLITSETDPRDPTFFPETTTADVILGLHYRLTGVRQQRGIEVIKARGTTPLAGLHALVITGDGISVFPQFEERVARDLLAGEEAMQGGQRTTPEIAPPTLPLQRVAFGLPEFDHMLAGGIPRATCTVLAGSLGTGKTLLALYFALAGIRLGEPVVFLGFRESRAQLLQVAASFDMALELARALAPNGGLTFFEVPPIKVNPDVIADNLLRAIDAIGAQRVIIDSIAEIEHSIRRNGDPERIEEYLAALLLSLRVRQVSGLLLKENDKALAVTLDFSTDALSVLAENVLLLQQVPYAGELHRILSIPKLRFTNHDAALREFRITSPQGIQVLASSESVAGVLNGITRDQERQQTGRYDAQQQEA